MPRPIFCYTELNDTLLLVCLQNSAQSVVRRNEQFGNELSPEKQKLVLLQNWASIAEERAATAERQASVAEERAIRAEETASVTMKAAIVAEERSITAEKRAITAEEAKRASETRATLYEERAIAAETRAASAETRAASAEQRATAAEQRAIAAEGKAITFEQRATLAEKECAVSKQKCSEALQITAAAEERARTAERRATIAEERANVANKNAITTEKRAVVAEARVAVTEKRASVAEERIKVAEMETIAAEKKGFDATTMVTTIEERTRKAEDAVKVFQERACMSENRIAELVQTNAALEGRATRAELQIRDMAAQCSHLQEQLDKANEPSWVLKKQDITFTGKELGRGGWGVVRAAKFCGLDVAAKLLHGQIQSTHNRQLFMREMNIAALVRHPNILLFIGATMDQECVILTELMQTSLRAVLEELVRDKLSMTRQQVSNIAMDVGKALNYMHLMKPDAIIHRDVSSGNVLLEQLGADRWKAKLSDFGASNFSCLIKTAGPGNFTYAAPESADPDLQSPKMDVFSYGILLLEMSYGHFPDVQKRQELIQKLTWSTMKAMIMECITKDLKCRPSMADVLIKLNSI